MHTVVSHTHITITFLIITTNIFKNKGECSLDKVNKKEIKSALNLIYNITIKKINGHVFHVRISRGGVIIINRVDFRLDLF